MSTTAQPTVLVVDDDPDTRESLSAVLEFEGFGVVTAENGAQALERLQGGLVPVVILLDIMMPQMSGYEVFARLQVAHAWAGIPVVVISAVAGMANRRELEGVKAILQKPVSLTQLVKLIRETLA